MVIPEGTVWVSGPEFSAGYDRYFSAAARGSKVRCPECREPSFVQVLTRWAEKAMPATLFTVKLVHADRAADPDPCEVTFARAE